MSIQKKRPSPDAHASEQQISTIKIGNNSNKWIVLENNSGIKKWVELKSPVKKYYTICNGAKPYLVIVAENTIIIMKQNNKKFDNVHDKLVYKINKYKNIFPGTNTNKFGGPHKAKFVGSSILVETKLNEYIFICDNIYKFKTTSQITNFYSIMGNSNVPYPFAVSKDKIYLMIEQVYLNSEDWNNKKDPYEIYYKNNNKKSNLKISTFSVEIIDSY
jgi:hypothetical protein